MQLEGAAKEGLVKGGGGAGGPITAVFIRAPAILEVRSRGHHLPMVSVDPKHTLLTMLSLVTLQAGAGVQVLAKVQARPCAAAQATVEGVYEQQQGGDAGALC